MTPDRRSVLILSPELGAFSQPWLVRQAKAFTRLSPVLAAWRCEPAVLDGALGLPAHALDGPLEPDSGDDPKRWGRRLRNAPSRNFFAARGADAASLDALFHAVRPAAVLAHFGHTALRVLPVARRHGVPVVAHFHGLDASSSLRNRWYRWSLPLGFRHWSHSVVVGSHQREALIGLGADPARVSLIPCGVPVGTFETAPMPLGPPDAPFRFVGVSRLVPWKGPDLTLRAFAQAARGREDLRLTLIGDGDAGTLEGLRALAAELGVARWVELPGALPVDGVRRALRASHAFVQHSVVADNGWVEGFGVSIAEASATARPVIATRTGGIVDQVTDGINGLLVEPRDVDGMAAAMRRLADEPARAARLGAAGRENAEKALDTAQLAGRLETLLCNATPEDRSI